MLISIHVVLALGIATIVAIGLRTNRFVTVFGAVVGVGLYCGLLIGISALQGHSSLLGSSSPTAFNSNIHDIPILRPFSRSVQVSNLVQRLSTFTSLAMGYVIVLITLIVWTVVQRVRSTKAQGDTSILFLLLLCAIVLLSWTEFESAAPTSYLVYILPVLSIAASRIAWKCLPIEGRQWIVSIVSVLLLLCGFKDAPGPRGVGYHATIANDHAVTEALSQVSHGVDNPRPLVLAFNPAVHDLLHDTSVRFMTTQFVEFPAIPTDSVERAIKRQRASYILLYHSALNPGYMREVGPISKAAHELGTVIWQQTGVFTDIGRSYWRSEDFRETHPDTLLLYKLYE